MASWQKRGKNSYLLTVEVGYDANGKRLRKTKTIRVHEKLTPKKLKEYLNTELTKFKIEVEAGEYIAPEKMTLAQFIPEWEKKYAEKHLSESTLEAYLTNINNHIIPSIGHMRLDQVKPINVINFLGNLKRRDGRDNELATGTIQFIYRVLRNIFSRAVQWKIIKENPVASVQRPKDTRQNEPNVYDEEEVALLFNSIENKPLHWRLMVTLILAAGLRRGEILGLEWKHIDLNKGIIHVKQEIVRGRNGRPVIQPPKWNKTRIVSLSSSVVKELESYRRHWKKEKMKALNQWIEHDHEFVFCNWNGTHFYPTTPSTWWRRTIKRVGLRYIRLHDLRHTSATLLINQGVHAKIISERLGHADIRVTMDTYGHALQAADKEAANKLDSIFANKKKSL